MILCINKKCNKIENPDELMDCQACGSELLINGAYRAVKKLGEGGFAKTYEVLDSKDQCYVLKILVKLDDKSIELFEREIDALKKLNHPGIPKYHDNFTLTLKNPDVQYPCIVMERIEGVNLEEWMEKRKREPINEKRALEWLHQLSLILHEIHKNSFFHKDIKLSNIMLNGKGNLVLVDFGLARFIDKKYEEDLKKGNITKACTSDYAPNEQKAGYATPQSDFFALGRTLVFLLTGKDRNTLEEKAPNNHTETKFNWRDENPNLSTDLGDFIDKLMDKNQNKRPKNTEEILKLIDGLILKLSHTNVKLESQKEEKQVLSQVNLQKHQFSAKVAKVVNEYNLIINKGKIHGVKEGQVMEVYGLNQQVNDPDTGEFLGYNGKPKGTGVVISVEEKIATLKSNNYYYKLNFLDLRNVRKILDSSL
jgi:serine/threonine protein kinase